MINATVACPHCGHLTWVTLPQKPQPYSIPLLCNFNRNPAGCMHCGERFSVEVDQHGHVSIRRQPY